MRLVFRVRKMRLRIFIAALTITLLFTFCDAHQHWFRRKSSMESEQRSMASAVMDYLDMVYPKDDYESRMLKWVFSILTDNESFLGGLMELMM
ncbi:hypothetical protein SFRURICE_011755 [Spodoptera frugiperda]|uniref:SFRICE_020578 n=1 Tax=Spodoptera frugiperda TaxID=7108 RepID=A0A2H1VZG4_SPOFR|nr:hypothetical protein SFRURICE_011755 [Spodoptera frugiperda]